MSELTPYDTGKRAEPKLWVRNAGTTRDGSIPDDEYGKVDFDDDEGSTVATLWIERQEDGTYVLKGYTNSIMTIEVEEQ